jgi:long-chain acyl-CoA synthetase
LNMNVYNASTMLLLPRFVPKDVLAAIQKYHPDLFPGIPTMYLAIAREIEKRNKGEKVDSVRICLSGAAPLLAEVQSRFEKVSGAHICEGYGLTEASPVTHSNPLWGDRRLGTIGVPLPATESRIVDPQTDMPMPVGERGEIVIRGPQVMQGYWNRPDETAKVLKDGWLHTGDIGVMDADGYFAIVDRAKDLIIAGGYNIYPREVEEVVAKYPAVQEVVVVGVPDEYRGESVRAYVVLKEGQTATADEIIQFCKQELAVYKIPKQVVFRADLPKTLIGKPLRRTLRDEAIAEYEAKKQQSK